MPRYDYACTKCGKAHNDYIKRVSEPAPDCCEQPMEQVFSPVPIHFKGTGFYVTDYGKGGGRTE
jgi:putative FmdB family regulatory protein